MKFSVLIPTRNRLELLKYAVETVMRQRYSDWEIVIADNGSEQGVAPYVAGLGDARVRYFRTERFLPVTENWNFALSKSAGDYFIMLGDDDCLLREYFKQQSDLIERFSGPDLTYSDAFQYAYPGVVPGHPEGFVQIGYTEFFRRFSEPCLLPRADAIRAVENSMRFRVTFGYNMQHFLVSRRLVETLSRAGPFFQSPYPDYYASNVLLLKADRILIVPRPMVAIGISRKSFGYYYLNQREAEGTSFLKNEMSEDMAAELSSVLLPGSGMNTSWLAAMETIKRNFPEEAVFPVEHSRYRLLQIISVWSSRGIHGLIRLIRHLTVTEVLFVLPALAVVLAIIRLLPGRSRQFIYARLGAYPSFDIRRKPVPYNNILEVFENLDPEYY